MPTHLSPPKTTHQSLIRSGNADAILATLVVAAGLVVCAFAWTPPVDGQPAHRAHHASGPSAFDPGLVSLANAADRSAPAPQDE